MTNKKMVGKFEILLEAARNAYGFGHDWTLCITDSKTKRTVRFWMGQDVKVVSRALGMSMDYAVDYYGKKANGSKCFDDVSGFIALDLLRVNLDLEIDEEITPKQVEKLMSSQAWAMAVQ